MVPNMLIVALLVGSACAATYIGYQPQKPKEFAKKEGCYIEEIKDVIPFGATVTPLGYCYRIHCSSDGLDYATCGLVGTEDPKCHVTAEDTSKLYPQCCSDVECDLDNSVI